ncbi:protein nrt1/ ptr family 2.8 [Quercus suber]|uniref:Protein nrt1/ ptr family 2.8 n=1 Tax=Quercus suber TaxID=58331 RepID=A0AAW0JKW3_QUESU
MVAPDRRNESFEKLASMSLISNITVYLTTKYNLSGIFVVNVVNIWSGSSNITSLAGAFVADAYLGRFRYGDYDPDCSYKSVKTPNLRWSTSIPLPHPQSWQLAFLFIALAFLSLGAGGIRPCNIAFGADQFDINTKKGRSQLESFFNWWYFSFTIALVVALTAVVYIQTNFSWVLGFAIPTACLAVSITIFLLGCHSYFYKNPRGSIFTDIAKVITAACRKHHLTVGPASQHSFMIHL